VGNSTLKVAGLSTIECKVAEAKGKLNASGDGVNSTAATIEFKTCVVVGQPACTVTEPIVASNITSQFFKNSETVFVEEGASGKFAEISITGASCLVAISNAKVVGNQKCTAATGVGGVEEELAEHEIKCAETGSDLEFAGKDAKLVLNEKLSLTGVAKWAVGAS
jgi:hypothetical protein